MHDNCASPLRKIWIVAQISKFSMWLHRILEILLERFVLVRHGWVRLRYSIAMPTFQQTATMNWWPSIVTVSTALECPICEIWHSSKCVEMSEISVSFFFWRKRAAPYGSWRHWPMLTSLMPSRAMACSARLAFSRYWCWFTGFLNTRPTRRPCNRRVSTWHYECFLLEEHCVVLNAIKISDFWTNVMTLLQARARTRTCSVSISAHSLMPSQKSCCRSSTLRPSTCCSCALIQLQNVLCWIWIQWLSLPCACANITSAVSSTTVFYKVCIYSIQWRNCPLGRFFSAQSWWTLSASPFEPW